MNEDLGKETDLYHTLVQGSSYIDVTRMKLGWSIRPKMGDSLDVTITAKVGLG